MIKKTQNIEFFKDVEKWQEAMLFATLCFNGIKQV